MECHRGCTESWMPSHVTFNKASLTSAVEHVLLVAKIYFCFAQPQDVTEKASTNGHVATGCKVSQGLHRVSLHESRDRVGEKQTRCG